MSSIRMQAGESTIQATVETAGSETSKFTGADLRTIVVTFRTHNDQQRDLVKGILDGGAVVVLNQDGQPNCSCSVFQKQYSYQNDSSVITHTWELKEKEELVIDKLVLEGLEFTPYAYEEEIDNSALIINAKLNITAEDRDKIEDLPLYFSVVRKGISDSPRQMRFGRVLWSDTGEALKYGPVLVEQCYDDMPEKKRGILEPELSNIKGLLSTVAEEFKGLVDLLVAKGTITADERTSLLDVSKENLRRRSRNFYCVNDIDEW